MKQRVSLFAYMLAVILFSACGNRQMKNIIFDGQYPPLKIVTYTENGKSYEISAITGQCLLFFSDEISQPQAQAIIEQNGGKIIEQMPSFNYYLAQVSEGKENDFIVQMRQRGDIEYAFLNIANQFLTEIYILDNFKDMEESLLTTHGNAVRRTFSKYAHSSSIRSINRKIMNNVQAETKTGLYWEAFKTMITANSVCTDLLNVVETADNNEVTLINMSFGVGLQKKNKRDLFMDVSENSRDNYQIEYKESLKELAVCFDKMRRKGVSNFLVTKSSGNDGMYNLQNIISELDNNTLQSLHNNMILVNAYDTKTDVLYSNNTNIKHTLTTTIDVTSEPWKGTSFAAPKLLGFIDKIKAKYPALNAQDMLQAVRNATPEITRQPTTYEVLEREAKEIADYKKQCKQFNFVLDMTSEYSGEWDLLEGKKQDVIKYKVHDTYSYDYLSGKKKAIDIDNRTNYDLEIILNVLDADNDIRSMRYILEQGKAESFCAYQTGTMNILSIKKLGVKIMTW
ncbi:hypothetical protein AGMMS49574_07950 [Bacteroidia bacterium]|nr:hypothetical protein AGMMS49574_07950 [Bacteroidia bacterium]